MLQFIAGPTQRYGSPSFAALVMIDNDCKWVQLRMKDAPREALRKEAEHIRFLTHNYKATFIIDDDVEMAREVDADGVHLGKTDMPVSEARAILGPDKIIGATANTFEDIQYAVAQGADYIGLGPFRFTETKKNLSPILGIEGYATIMEQCRQAGITEPIVAIGGITTDDIQPLMSTGISGIAVSSGLVDASDPVWELMKMQREMSDFEYKLKQQAR